MKKTLIILSLFLFNICSAQDIIVKSKAIIEKKYCKNLQLSNKVLNYTSLNSDSISKINFSEIFGINFYNDKPTELLLLSIQFDTIKGKIDSISTKNVLYRDESNVLQKIKKEDVFFIQFNQLSNIDNIENYKQQYIAIQSNRYAGSDFSKVIKTDGKTYEAVKIISIKNDKVEVEILLNDKPVRTYISINDIGAIINKEFIPNRGLALRSNFILTKDNKFKEADVNGVDKDKLILSTIINQNPIDFPQDKNTINGIFFLDYNKIISATTNTTEYLIKNNIVNKTGFKLDVNAGMGYMTAESPNGLSALEEKYIDELRTGFAFDINLVVYIGSSFGLGVKYNQFNTSNSISDVSDDITVQFIAPTISRRIALNSLLYYNFEVSAGYLSETNNAKIGEISANITGNTFGLYFKNSLEICLSDELAISANLSYLYGKISEYKVNNVTLKLSDPDNLSRIDGMLGLKFYF